MRNANTSIAFHKVFYERYTRTAGSRSRAECEVAMGNKYLDGTALTLVIIGALNWLLIGIFRFDLVAFIFGNMSWVSRIVYGLVGLCGLYLISFYMHLSNRSENA